MKETGGQEKPSDKEDSWQRETMAAKSPVPVWRRHTPKRFEGFVRD